MADGVRIGLTVYLPDGLGDGPFPVVVESVPYRKDEDFVGPDWRTYAYLAQRGIAGIRVDVRGTGASEGIATDEYTAQEMADTLEILTWAAGQDWSNGNVGMWGISWGGFSSLQAAMARPPELKAIVAAHATHDRFATDVHYVGGSLHAAEQADWPGTMVAYNGLPPDPEIVGDRWMEMWMEPTRTHSAMAVQLAPPSAARRLLAAWFAVRRLRIDRSGHPPLRRMARWLCRWDARVFGTARLPQARGDRPLGPLSTGDRSTRADFRSSRPDGAVVWPSLARR